MNRIQLDRRTSRRGLAAGVAVAALCLIGCDGGGGGDPDVMVMRPAETQPADPATKPAVLPATKPADAATGEALFASAPSWISIDDEPHEFPPAKLFLKRTGETVKVKLFGREPDEAAAKRAGREGQSFYFEMEIELPAAPEDKAGESVSPADLASAEWVFHAPSSEQADTPSGIVIGGVGGRRLQPADVLVSFDPLDENLVIVTLAGTFNEFDAKKPRDATRERQVRVQAVLSAETLRR